jgi:D-3-phosphoglycerate dehydrogenase / 2-oxoglutarate reductase
LNVLIADAFSEAAIDRLRASGHTLRVDPSLKGGALTEAIASFNPNVLVVRSTKVTGADLDASPALELVVRAGAGVDTIDVDGASARGIFVSNCPGKNATAVAELAFGLILALDRRIPDNVQASREGRWEKGAFSKADGIKGKTLGLVGLGSIGREMIARARAFEMEVVAWSRSLTEAGARELGVRRASDPLDLARQADVVSLHVASTPDTVGLVDAAFLEAMRPGAWIVNTARDAVVDEAALAAVLETKGLRFATDVPSGEPADKKGAFQHPLMGHPSVYITHHIGASTEQATEAIGAEAERVVQAYAETGRALNAVNLADRTPATHLLTVRHRDRVGVLAHVLDEVRRAGWNVQEMENLIFTGAEAASARIRFDGRPDGRTLEAIRTQEHVLAAIIIPL